jgi:hypothetical protein
MTYTYEDFSPDPALNDEFTSVAWLAAGIHWRLNPDQYAFLPTPIGPRRVLAGCGPARPGGHMFDLKGRFVGIDEDGVRPCWSVHGAVVVTDGSSSIVRALRTRQGRLPGFAEVR